MTHTPSTTRRAASAALMLACAAALSGCWFDSPRVADATAAAPTVTPAVDPGTATAATLSGQVYAAGVSGAVVSVYLADVAGAATGAALATATTDSLGRYSLTLPTVPGGPVLVVAVGGTYTSEADGSTQTLGTLATLLASIAAGANTAHINPLTNTIAAAAARLLAQGGLTLAQALAQAAAVVNPLFGVAALSADPSLLLVDPLATAGDGWWLAALLGTLEQLRVNAAIPAAALYQALRDDAADGRLDGLQGTLPVSLGGAGTAASTLAASLFTTQWSGAANAYAASQPRYAAATVAISGALQASAQAAGLAIGSSGSIAPLLTQAGGTQLYFAARGDGLVMLDMSDPAHPVASRLAAINRAVMRNTSVSPATGSFSSLDGIVINPTPINTAARAKVFAILYSYASKTVVSVNLTDGVVADSVALPISKSTQFSGASASIAGGIADGKRGRIWLATGDGLLGVDPSNLQAPVLTIAQPTGTQINENLGGDPAKDIVYSPDYQNRGLVVFNLAEVKAYVMDNTAWRSTVGSFANGSEVDGVALDSQYSVAVMNLEGSTSIGVMAYTTPSGAAGEVGSLSAGARFKAFASAGTSLAGAAIDPVSHTGLFVGEGAGLAVGVLDDPAGASWAGFSRFVRAGTTSYRFEPHDPHTVGAFSIAGKPYGFVLQGSSKPYRVGVIDLTAFLAAPTSGGALVTDPLADASITQLLSY